MWEWYRIGLSLGLGIALGGLLSALLAPRRALLGMTALAAAAGAAARRVRLVVRRDPCRRHAALDPRRDLQHERTAPGRRGCDRLRGARGRRPHRGGRERDVLPRAHPAPSAPAGARAAGLRTEAL